jgi:hypothetical protein
MSGAYITPNVAPAFRSRAGSMRCAPGAAETGAPLNAAQAARTTHLKNVEQRDDVIDRGSKNSMGDLITHIRRGDRRSVAPARTTVESCLCLDIDSFARKGLPKLGEIRRDVRDSRTGEVTRFTYSFSLANTRVRLQYTEDWRAP